MYTYCTCRDIAKEDFHLNISNTKQYLLIIININDCIN